MSDLDHHPTAREKRVDDISDVSLALCACKIQAGKGERTFPYSIVRGSGTFFVFGLVVSKERNRNASTADADDG